MESLKRDSIPPPPRHDGALQGPMFTERVMQGMGSRGSRLTLKGTAEDSIKDTGKDR
jgi:hypothetical protein